MENQNEVTTSAAILALHEMRDMFKVTKEYEDIRAYIFAEYEQQFNKPLSRTTFSNWMKGEVTPNMVQLRIIEKALLSYGRIKK